MIRILIVEDDVNITKMLVATLSIGEYEVETCDNGIDAVDRMLHGPFDLTLLDVMLPGRDGFAVLDAVRRAGGTIPVIFLTALGDVTDKVKGLRGGAEDYIVKPFEAMELLARIEVVMRRVGKSEMFLSYQDILVDMDQHIVTKGGEPVMLTPKEFEVLVFFIRNPDIAITREQLLNNIWGYAVSGKSRSVDIHVQQVRRKLDLQGSLVTLPKLGYRLERSRG
ncbi:MAG: response regulator transcription factor [Clostridia bacterium]|nr:response regulator transcription factor [Clostridia bacterium]